MLKNLRFSGIFYDDTLSVNVTLENPMDYGFNASALLFSVMVRNKDGNITTLASEDFTFYIMDEANRLYNAQSTYTPVNGDSVLSPGWLIHTDFKSEFLFQNLRIAFFHPDYTNIIVIELKH